MDAGAGSSGNGALGGAPRGGCPIRGSSGSRSSGRSSPRGTPTPGFAAIRGPGGPWNSCRRRVVWPGGGRGPWSSTDLTLLEGRSGLGESVTARAPDVVTLHGPGFDGLESPSPIRYAARQTAVGDGVVRGAPARAAQRGQPADRDHDRGGAVWGGSSRNSSGNIRTRSTRTTGRRGARGRFRSSRPAFGLDTVGGLSAADIQLIELLKWSVEDIGRAFGVPPRMLGHFHEGAKVATTFEGHAVDFERWSIAEHVQRVQAQLTTKLVSADDAAEGLVVRLPADRIRAGSWTRAGPRGGSSRGEGRGDDDQRGAAPPTVAAPAGRRPAAATEGRPDAGDAERRT